LAFLGGERQGEAMQEPSTPVPVSEWLTPLDVSDRLGISRTLVYGLMAAYDRGEAGLRYKRVSARKLFIRLDWFHEYMEQTRGKAPGAA
jgi:hypothetical protein